LFSDPHKTHKLSWQNVECLHVKPDDIYIYIYEYNHLFFEGLNYFNLNLAPLHSNLYYHHTTLQTTAVHIACSSVLFCSVLYDSHNKQRLFLQNKIKRFFFIVLTQRVRCDVIIATSQRLRCVRNYNSSLYICQYL
jgi:hypothetical protein